MFHLEKESEAKLVKTLEDAGALVVKFTDPRRRGGPDRLVIGDPFDFFFFVETKTPHGKLAPLQIRYARELHERMVDVYLIDSPQKVEEFLTKRLELRPNLGHLLLLSSVA
jgi:hypothetical protein